MISLLNNDTLAISKNSDISFTYFLKPDLNILNNDIKEYIVKECGKIQDAVWNKKFETSDNTLAQDHLILIFDNKEKK